ncbi:MAG: SH3 domain-containing protein [Anaerolineae bacterium]|nr:SH3 domain-containing protein [Anaerolineae bacterium]
MRKALLFPLLLLCIWFPVQALDDGSCPESLPPRLTVGEVGRVTPGDANNVRAAAAGSAELTGQIPGGSVFHVLDGPECAGGFTWWQVRYGELEGWTVEGSDAYWLEPLTGMEIYEDEYIRFAYFADGMGEISREFYEAYLDDDQMGGPRPEQRFYTIEEWPTEMDWKVGQIAFAPISQITEEMWRYVPVIEILQEVLSDEAASPLRFPSLASNAMRAGVAKSGLVDFANGRGLVFATMYQQDIFPFIPDEYDFYGLTNGGNYLVWASFNVDTAETSVPFDRQDYIDVTQETQERYGEYSQAVAAELADRPDEEFTPNLANLRLMIETIEILGW